MNRFTINNREELLDALKVAGIFKDFDDRLFKIPENWNVVIDEHCGPVYRGQRFFKFISFSSYPTHSNAPHDKKMSYDSLVLLMEKFYGDGYAFEYNEVENCLDVYSSTTVLSNEINVDNIGIVCSLKISDQQLTIDYMPVGKTTSSLGMTFEYMVLDHHLSVEKLYPLNEPMLFMKLETHLRNGDVITDSMSVPSPREYDSAKQELFDTMKQKVNDLIKRENTWYDIARKQVCIAFDKDPSAKVKILVDGLNLNLAPKA